MSIMLHQELQGESSFRRGMLPTSKTPVQGVFSPIRTYDGVVVRWLGARYT